VAVVFGTRPEAVKLAPLVMALEADNRFTPRVIVTAQHRGMLDQVLELFEITPDHDLDIMATGQTLAEITARALDGLAPILARHRPSMVAVQGDTSTTLAGALAAAYEQLPVVHLEAGLRTGDRRSPFPEELNRTMVSRLADLHLAPTPVSAHNLLAEGIDPTSVLVTGNTVIDALGWAVERVSRPNVAELGALDPARPLVLVTAHRRESLDGGMDRIARGIEALARSAPETEIVIPLHLNPVVRCAFAPLVGIANVSIIEPLSYPDFAWLLDRCDLVLTDSGGVQEEAPTLGKPVLVMRDTTERPEAIEAGVTRLVGTDSALICAEALELLRNPVAHRAMAGQENPFGDGHATERSLDAIAWHLGITKRRPEPFASSVGVGATVPRNIAV